MTGRRAIALAVARRRVLPTEHETQCAVMTVAALYSDKYPELELLYAIPNGGHRHKAVAAKLKASGVKAGVPDLCLPVARGGYHGLYVELKRERGGRTSPAQHEWHNRLCAEGYRMAICAGAGEATSAILTYLNLTPAEPPEPLGTPLA